MALIEVSNACNSDMAVTAAYRSRLAMFGEPIVAVDLINTVAVPGSPVADDFLAADRGGHGAHPGSAATGPASPGTTAAPTGPDWRP